MQMRLVARVVQTVEVVRVVTVVQLLVVTAVLLVPQLLNLVVLDMQVVWSDLILQTELFKLHLTL
jgi:hypothetical protein